MSPTAGRVQVSFLFGRFIHKLHNHLVKLGKVACFERCALEPCGSCLRLPLLWLVGGAAIESASESLSRRECGLTTHGTHPAPDNPLRDRLDRRVKPV